MQRRALVLLALGTALAACSSDPGEYAPGPASVDEQQALSDAAEMLEERPPEGEHPSDAVDVEDGNR